MPWNSLLNAEIYDRFTRDHAVYDWLNQHIVTLAQLGSARCILDLACGTGATTAACLREMAPRAELVGIDASASMVGVAHGYSIDPRVRFEVMAAADAHRLPERFDRIVCCAAFWQFPSRRDVFRALAACTEPGARMVFNIPAERVQGQETPVHPIQTALITEIQRESGRHFGGEPVRVDPALLAADARACGFEQVEQKRLVYQGPQGELLDLISIPAMIGPLTEGLDDDARERLLQRLRERVDLELTVEVPWIYFIVERR